MQKLLLLVVVLTFGLTLAYGQKKGEINGIIIDSVTSEPLSLATITLFNVTDTSVISYKLSDYKGEFKLTGLPLNVRSRLLVSYSGYAPLRMDVLLTEEASVLQLDSVVLHADPEALEEVIFTMERPPVLVKNDTIEFNANSFKTLPTALVEDLLKKLPGVDVDGEGNITVNGKRVNRILVDGKTFFGDDPKMASRNLPANLIDKIQVTDDKEELDRLMDNNTENIGKVINLTFKKDVKMGWFGKVYGGGGTEDRYEAGAIANIFRDTMQLSIMAFSNNVNRSGFSMGDIQSLGGFSRSGFQSISVSRSGGAESFNINGINFGGGGGGVTRSTGAGFNLNHAPTEKQSFYLQYFYGQGKNIIEDKTFNQQYIKDSIIDINSFSNAVGITNRHNVGAGFKLKPNKFTDFNFSASLSASDNDNNKNLNSETISNKLGILSSTTGHNYNNGNQFSYNHYINFSKRWEKKQGRSFTMYHGLTLSKNESDFITDQDNLFYQPFTDTVAFAQLRNNNRPTTTASLQASFSEPLTKSLSLRISERINYAKNIEDINTYGRLNGNYDQKIESLSNYLSRINFTSSTRASLSYKIKKLTLSAGVNALHQDVKDGYFKTAAKNQVTLFNLLPEFSINYNGIYLSYDEGVSMPSLQNLNPIIDNSNPFRIIEGNPDLQPVRTRGVYFNFFKFDMKSSINYSAYGSLSYQDNGIITSRIVQNDGVQIFKPVNAGGNNSQYLYLFAKKDFKKSTGFIFSVGPRISMNGSKRKLMVNEITSDVNALSFSPGVTIGLDWKSKIEFRPGYSYSINRTKYADASFNDLTVRSNNLEAELILRPLKNFVFETNLRYYNNSNASMGMPESYALWNAGVTFLFLKEQKGHLKLSVYDILNENNDYRRTVSENFINEYRSNVLQRYFLLTFTYNIRTMGEKQKVGGTQRFFFF